MLGNTHIVTTLPVVNLDRACSFYGDTLGLKESGRLPSGGVIFRSAEGSELELVPHDQPSKAEHTAASFEVDSVEREIQDLESRGVRFEDYDMPGLKTEHHVAVIQGEKCAWFKDPEGNILCIHEGAH